jgi:hypothetical protein
LVVAALASLSACDLSVNGRQGAVLDAGGDEADGGPSDRPDGAAAVTACAAFSGARYCEAFEDPELPEMWRTEISGVVSVDPTLTYRGDGALRARIDETIDPDNQAHAIAHAGHRVFESVEQGTLRTRAYVYVPSSSSGEMTFLALSEDAEPYEHVSTGLDVDGTLRIDALTASHRESSDFLVPRDRWLCVELAIDVDAAAGSATVKVDGVARVVATGLDTRPGGGYDNVIAGVGWAPSAQTDAEVYLDELVVDSGPTPCD